MALLYVLRVFTDERGEHGNPLGVFLEGGEVSRTERQAVAAELGFSETVFVDDAERGVFQIFTPAAEIPFAGHPTVGTAWLLGRAPRGQAPGGQAAGTRPVRALRPPPGEVGVRSEGERTYVSARVEWCPDFEFVERDDAAEVDQLDPAQSGSDTYNWAWIDREAGAIRARGFCPGWGIREDEATGSAALALSVALDRPIVVHQGTGSVIHARPLGGGRGEIGGDVALVERREH